MFLVIEDANPHDITLLRDRASLVSHLHARMVAGVDVEVEIDVLPVDQGARIEVSARVILLEAAA